MARNSLVRAAVGVGIVLIAGVVVYRSLQRNRFPRVEVASPAAESSTLGSPAPPAIAARPVTSPPHEALEPATAATAESSEGFLYGRVTTQTGATYEGRLRWGGGEEAVWSDYFNGFKADNPWASEVPLDRLPRVRHPLTVFGFEIAQHDRPADLGRFFMARFGDIARIESEGRAVRVTLKSGTTSTLDRFEASDFDDGVRVWDARQGVVDLDSLQIRSIELLPTALLSELPERLHGTVHTRKGDFTGFVQWDRELSLGSDELQGYPRDGASGFELRDGKVHVRFDSIASIARRSPASSLLKLLDGRDLALSNTRATGAGNRGVYVDDPRYGRVLVSWDAFERLDFSPRNSAAPAGSGPAYGDYPPGRPLTGSVINRSGRRLTGRLVYDLDESEGTETLDAPSNGVDYTLPFAKIVSIVLPGPEEKGAEGQSNRPRVEVTLVGGEVLRLEPSGDLGEENPGLLVFAVGTEDGGNRPSEHPEYVPWSDVARVELDGALAIGSPLASN